MTNANHSTQDKREYAAWIELRESIRRKTKPAIPINETELQKQTRITKLKADFVAFSKFYFAHYMTDEATGLITDFGWFHLKAAKTILPNTVSVLEWSREHAKSVFADLLFPLYLFNIGKLDGMVIASSTDKKAQKLLGDIQAEFEGNELLRHDYGDLTMSGNWQVGQFATTNGIGFWAFGLGQSPRGIREGAKRPNYCVVDDADTKERCKNEERVDETVNWIREDLFGAFGLKSGSRFVIAGNRIDKCSIVAKFVGDLEPGDPKDPNINHIKVYALENPKNHSMDIDGAPAWKERYSREDLETRWKITGYRAKMREYFHQHIQEGTVFRNEWIQFGKMQPLRSYKELVVYGDPSFKNTKASDYKAVVMVGKSNDNKLHVLRAWVRQATVSSMVRVYYDWFDDTREHARYYIEANMLQDLFLDEFRKTGNELGFQLPIRGDQRKKPDKFTRIENLTPLFERGLIIFNEKEKANPDMQILINQFLAFPTGHDDAPDATEGAIFFLQKRERATTTERRTGKFSTFSSRN